jgi:parallel beta-helix repeat protein
MNPIKIALIVLFLCISLTGLTQSASLTVGKAVANYASIQEAIAAAHDGDTIEVQSGTYSENVNVDKALILRGMGNPIIDSKGNGSAVKLDANGIILDGFKIINADKSGVEAKYSDNITIRDNIIVNNSAGITIDTSEKSSIIGNNISNNKYFGLSIDNSDSCEILRNTIYKNTGGIDLRGANRNIIRDNVILNNTEYGISLKNRLLSEAGPGGFSDGNLIEKNQIEGSRYGIDMKYSERNNISANRLIRNEYSIHADRSLNNTLKDNYYLNSTNNISSDGSSRNNIWIPHPDAVLLGLGIAFIVFILINIIMGGLIGIVAGAVIKRMLKYGGLGLIGNAILGAIGSVLGFYGCLLFLTSDLLIDFIAAAASAFVLILLIEVLRHRKGER